MRRTPNLLLSEIASDMDVTGSRDKTLTKYRGISGWNIMDAWVTGRCPSRLRYIHIVGGIDSTILFHMLLQPGQAVGRPSLLDLAILQQFLYKRILPMR